MTDLSWEQSQMHRQEVPVKPEAMTHKLLGVKRSLKKIPQAYT